MLEKKLIRSGEGFRLTFQEIVGGWRGYRGHTLVVRLPSRLANTFRVADVVTEGIQGQPQMTFDSHQAAVQWKEAHPEYAEWNIGATKKDYMCIKIPLWDGSECWLAESNFPPEGSEKWNDLLRTYPDYFRVGPGFFTEGSNTVTERVYTGPNLKLHEGDTFKTNTDEMVFKIPGIWLAGNTKFTVDQIYDDGTCDVSYYEEEYDWMGNLTSDVPDLTLSELEDQINIPGCIVEFNGQPINTRKVGFFESVNRTFNDSEEIKTIVLDTNLNADQKCDKLWDRPWEHVRDTINLNYEHRGQESPDCSNCRVYTVFYQNDPSEPLTLEQSFNHYVVSLARSTPLGWWKDIKKSIEYWENTGKVKKPERLGFFKEDLEVEQKPWNTVYKIADGNNNRGIVRIPKVRTDTFEFSFVDSMMTQYHDIIFFSEEEGNRWIQQHSSQIEGEARLIRNRSNWAGWEKFVKIPLSDGSVVHMSYIGIPKDPDAADNSPFHGHWFPSSGETEDWCRRWWEKVRRLYPDYFETRRLGFFNESLKCKKFGFLAERLNLKESYNVPAETFKRVIIKYVKDNGYIKGGWNGRYSTPSPTVEEINKLLRHVDDLTEYMCTEEELHDFDTWVNSVTPEGAQADWMRNCIDSWNKTNNLEPQDLKNLVSFVSYRDSNIKFQQRQAAKMERERQHQADVESDSNTWAGEVGDTVEFTVQECKIAFWVQPRSYYADSYPSWVIKGTDGKTYTWNDTKQEVTLEPGMKIKGKIKKLTEFRGIKQTQVWRIEISSHGTTLGFFTEDLNKPIPGTKESEWDALPTWKKAWRLNNIISNLNDESAYYSGWLYIWPDGEDEEQCEYDFSDEENYSDLERSFKGHYADKEVHDGGLYTSRGLPLEVIADAHMWDKKLGLDPIKWYDIHTGQWCTSKPGFFTESINNNWLKTNFDISVPELKELCDMNWELNGEDNCFYMENEEYGINVADPFYDDGGCDEFHTLEEICEFWGEDFIKEWIKEFCYYCEINGLIDRIRSERPRKGFFQD